VPEDIWESADALSPDDYENFEEAVVDQATAAQTIQELEAEIIILEGLEEQARQVVHSGQDRKWDELSRLLQDTPEMHDAVGRQRKLIIFTEHRDTLNYLVTKIRGLIGSEEAVVMIHGGVKREERRKVQELFRNDPDGARARRHRRGRRRREPAERQPHGQLRPAVEPEPAGAALRPHPPHRPDRGLPPVEHGRGRDARGRRLPAAVREAGAEREALGGRVFDILGEVFEDRSLKDLLIEAIRYGVRPRGPRPPAAQGRRRAGHPPPRRHHQAQRPVRRGDGREAPLRREGGNGEGRGPQAAALLHPPFFSQAFQQLGGELRPREPGRYEITNVPAIIRERDRQITGRDRRNADPVLRRYERVCFEKQYVRLRTAWARRWPACCTPATR
jgi:hypothetical protein